ncbi:MAG: nucleotide exchange factor GrpE [Hyphomonadaceae bacterium]|nr:nucleotide exchange factor GrpE [Hyphomonadaceae bacterium]
MTNDANAEQGQLAEATEAQSPEIAALEAELAKARDEMLRALAEVENTRRRAERQAADARAYAIDRFAGDLLPIADTLGRALAAAPHDSADDATRNLITGLELTERTLIDTFAKHGLKRVGAKGETFNPNLHQAVAQAPSDQPQGVILEVMQPGYMLGERTLRAAMVLVSSGVAQQAHTVDVKV